LDIDPISTPDTVLKLGLSDGFLDRRMPRVPTKLSTDVGAEKHHAAVVAIHDQMVRHRQQGIDPTGYRVSGRRVNN
jgi:hypothetical protein